MPKLPPNGETEKVIPAAEHLEREAVEKRNERGAPIRRDPIPADRAGRRNEAQGTAKQEVT